MDNKADRNCVWKFIFSHSTTIIDQVSFDLLPEKYGLDTQIEFSNWIKQLAILKDFSKLSEVFIAGAYMTSWNSIIQSEN